MLLSEAIERLVTATRADGRSARTVSSYREKLGPLLQHLGDVPVEGIRADDLRGYAVDLMSPRTLYVGHPTHKERSGSLSPFTVASRITAARRLFNWLEEEGYIPSNPMRRIKTSRPKRREPKGINRHDLIGLLAATEGDRPIDLRDRALTLFLADTGCRVGGLCGLRVQDVDLDAGVALVIEKRGKSRFVPYREETADALRTWLKVRPADRGEWVFVGLASHSKGALSPNSVCQVLKKRGKKGGVIGPVNPHAFRHGFARHYLLDGGDLATVSELMGHESMEITKDFYAIFTLGELKTKHQRHSPVAGLIGGRTDGDMR